MATSIIFGQGPGGAGQVPGGGGVVGGGGFTKVTVAKKPLEVLELSL